MKTILLVDDSKAIRMTMSFVMKNEGFDVIEAEDGLSALKLLDGRKINLIISDVNMPGLNGLEFVKKLKNETDYQAYRFVPVVMLTTESSYDKKKEGKDAGVRAWITKPFPPETLLDTISKLIG